VSRLVELELVSVVTAVELEGPARVLEVGFAARRLHHAIERYEFRHNDPRSHRRSRLLIWFRPVA
jgi:hypothetical protein